MNAPESRFLPKSAGCFFPGAAAAMVRITALEGAASAGEVTIKPLVVGDSMVMVEIFEAKGVRVPEHSHDDHESVVYLVKGRMRLVIDGQEFVAQAGDAWLHPQGVRHWSETLEELVGSESVQ